MIDGDRALARLPREDDRVVVERRTSEGLVVREEVELDVVAGVHLTAVSDRQGLLVAAPAVVAGLDLHGDRGDVGRQAVGVLDGVGEHVRGVGGTRVGHVDQHALGVHADDPLGRVADQDDRRTIEGRAAEGHVVGEQVDAGALPSVHVAAVGVGLGSLVPAAAPAGRGHLDRHRREVGDLAEGVGDRVGELHVPGRGRGVGRVGRDTSGVHGELPAAGRVDHDDAAPVETGPVEGLVVGEEVDADALAGINGTEVVVRDRGLVAAAAAAATKGERGGAGGAVGVRDHHVDRAPGGEARRNRSRQAGATRAQIDVRDVEAVHGHADRGEARAQAEDRPGRSRDGDLIPRNGVGRGDRELEVLGQRARVVDGRDAGLVGAVEDQGLDRGEVRGAPAVPARRDGVEACRPGVALGADHEPVAADAGGAEAVAAEPAGGAQVQLHEHLAAGDGRGEDRSALGRAAEDVVADRDPLVEVAGRGAQLLERDQAAHEAALHAVADHLELVQPEHRVVRVHEADLEPGLGARELVAVGVEEHVTVPGAAGSAALDPAADEDAVADVARHGDEQVHVTGTRVGLVAEAEALEAVRAQVVVGEGPVARAGQRAVVQPGVSAVDGRPAREGVVRDRDRAVRDRRREELDQLHREGAAQDRVARDDHVDGQAGGGSEQGLDGHLALVAEGAVDDPEVVGGEVLPGFVDEAGEASLERAALHVQGVAQEHARLREASTALLQGQVTQDERSLAGGRIDEQQHLVPNGRARARDHGGPRARTLDGGPCAQVDGERLARGDPVGASPQQEHVACDRLGRGEADRLEGGSGRAAASGVHAVDGIDVKVGCKGASRRGKAENQGEEGGVHGRNEVVEA